MPTLENVNRRRKVNQKKYNRSVSFKGGASPVVFEFDDNGINHGSQYVGDDFFPLASTERGARWAAIRQLNAVVPDQATLLSRKNGYDPCATTRPDGRWEWGDVTVTFIAERRIWSVQEDLSLYRSMLAPTKKTN